MGKEFFDKNQFNAFKFGLILYLGLFIISIFIDSLILTFVYFLILVHHAIVKQKLSNAQIYPIVIILTVLMALVNSSIYLIFPEAWLEVAAEEGLALELDLYIIFFGIISAILISIIFAWINIWIIRFSTGIKNDSEPIEEVFESKELFETWKWFLKMVIIFVLILMVLIFILGIFFPLGEPV